ncbi:hypothetical protein THMIRHAM_07560 [Thiomicrorhabdus immobilis]|uniref:Flagellar protein FlgJ N-terminal domain-containing protein n=1 Tax=Thiomicrorhabdus immobilis TaxID=2791037 RepID=A0ABM7MCA0_9GAMM|nr:rod-binding protein [Thiomicrorhabdus immobilis]BCN92971.1 hypothetical protein THMIRHAM_07560 [Thiomicrorhabdus immobilis]
MNINSRVDALANQSVASSEHQNYANLQGLDGLKQQAREDQRAALKPVAEQFEAIFVQQIFKEARKVSFDDGWLDGNQGDFYKDWHDKQLAQDLAAKGNLGFADKIVEQLLPSIPATKNIQQQEAVAEQNTQGIPEEKQQLVSSTKDALALRKIK